MDEEMGRARWNIEAGKIRSYNTDRPRFKLILVLSVSFFFLQVLTDIQNF